MFKYKVRTVLVQNKFGVPYFELTEEDNYVTSTLLSGFSSAISSMWSEYINNTHTGFEIIEREGLTITIHMSDLSSLLLISDQRPTDLIKGRIEKLHRSIENRFFDIVKSNSDGKFKNLPYDEVKEVFKEYNIDISALSE